MAVAFFMLSFDCPEKTESRPPGCASRETASAHKGVAIELEKTVGLKLKQNDSYGRWIATVYLNGEDVAEELLRQGLAWHFKEHDSNPRYAQLENEARWNGFGLWCDDRPVAPWRWRRMSKAERDEFRK